MNCTGNNVLLDREARKWRGYPSKEEPSRPRAQPVQRPRGRSVLLCLLKAWPGGLWLGGVEGRSRLGGRAERWEWGNSSDLIRPSKGFGLHGEKDEEPLRRSEERGHDLP